MPSRNNSKKTKACAKQNRQINKNIFFCYKIKDGLYKMLVREKRLELYNESIKFLKTRIKLDQSGFTEDIFQH